ncbi:MAG: tetratricopeptide repeat protein [Pseudomonadota bacterium]
MARQVRLLLLAALFAAMPLCSLAGADFKRDYLDALDALQAGALGRAEALLKRAIQSEPESQPKVRLLGMRFAPYVPYLYLGSAKFGQGDCDGAIAAWELEIERGIARSDPVFELLRTGMAACGVTAPESGPYALDDTLRPTPARNPSFKKHYLLALEHYELGEYAAAEASLEEALTLEPRPLDKVRLIGMRFVPYMPYYYLAAARLELGDCAGAAAAWTRATTAGVATREPVSVGFPDELEACGS